MLHPFMFRPLISLYGIRYSIRRSMENVLLHMVAYGGRGDKVLRVSHCYFFFQPEESSKLKKCYEM